MSDTRKGLRREVTERPEAAHLLHRDHAYGPDLILSHRGHFTIGR